MASSRINKASSRSSIVVSNWNFIISWPLKKRRGAMRDRQRYLVGILKPNNEFG